MLEVLQDNSDVDLEGDLGKIVNDVGSLCQRTRVENPDNMIMAIITSIMLTKGIR